MKIKDMKLLFIIFFSFFLLTGIHGQTLILKPYIGDQKTYPLSEIKKVTFSSNSIHIRYKGNYSGWGLKYIRSLNFQLFSTNFEESEDTENTILLYPNPVADVLNIQTSSKSCAIEIFSGDGKLVFKQNAIPMNDVMQISLSSLQPGFYFCTIDNGESLVSSRFIKL